MASRVAPCVQREEDVIKSEMGRGDYQCEQR
jgi:hypothetical protein